MLNEILKDVGDYIAWELEEGTVTVEASPDILAALSTPSLGVTGSTPSPKPEPTRSTPSPKPEPTRSAPSPKPGGTGSTPSAVHMEPKVFPPSAPAIPPALSTLAAEIAVCTRCGLHAGRTNTVPGQGNPQPEILFIGEAPGKDEDEQGLAFVGRAGQLLTKMIEAMGFAREDVFIANINKCRPPDNRKPTREEMDTCLPFLKRQIAILKPKVIIAMGATAVEGLVTLPEGDTISKVRGQWLQFEGIPLMPTYHPAYLLRNPAMKHPVWEDLKTVLGFLGRPVPAVKK